MISHYMKLLTEVFNPPIYVFQTAPAGIHCEKLTDPDKTAFKRQRYLITGGSQCTCMAWMKSKDSPKMCKHLQMLNGDYSWVKGGGVGPDYMKRMLEDLVRTSADALPLSSKAWELVAAEVPDTAIQCISLPILDKMTKPFDKIAATRTFMDKKEMMVELFYDVKNG